MHTENTEHESFNAKEIVELEWRQPAPDRPVVKSVDIQTINKYIMHVNLSEALWKQKKAENQPLQFKANIQRGAMGNN